MQERAAQLAYSELQSEMSSKKSRLQKAGKIQAVLDHFLGEGWTDKALFLDIGASLGWTVEVAAGRGARAMGVDIDVPGLIRARQQRDDRCFFACADGGALPFADESLDVVIFNHIYEHVVDPDAVMSEIRRVLKPEGAVYLGLGNRMGLIEPHYKLPFLSWLPKPAADRYIRLTGKADEYYEHFQTIPGLRKLAGGLFVHDYSFSVIAEPQRFGSDDQVNGLAAATVKNLPKALYGPARAGLFPTVIWVGSKSDRKPAGPSLAVDPQPIVTKLRPR